MMYIDKVSKYVARHGREFEKYLETLANEGDKRLQFLLQPLDSPASVYYRWRVCAYLNGDTQTQYSTTPFMIYGQGHLWVPPSRSETKGDENSENSVKTNEKFESTVLSEEDRTYLLRHLLPNLSTKRGSIRDAMVWCIDRSRAADDLISQLYPNISQGSAKALSETPLRSVASAYLINDLLHNAGASTAKAGWQFRSALEKMLPPLAAQIAEGGTPELVEAWRSCAASWISRELFDHHFVRGVLLELDGPPKEGEDEEVILTEKDTDQITEWREYDDAQLDKVCETHGISALKRNKEDKLLQLTRWLTKVAGDRQELDGLDVSDDDISELSHEDEEMSDGEPLEEDDSEAVPDNWETLDDNPDEEDVDGEPVESAEPASALSFGVSAPTMGPKITAERKPASTVATVNNDRVQVVADISSLMVELPPPKVAPAKRRERSWSESRRRRGRSRSDSRDRRRSRRRSRSRERSRRRHRSKRSITRSTSRDRARHRERERERGRRRD
ncbi:U2 snRNP-associated SURP domain-containing protein [Perkinsus olseni]|uniref:U2 snRNP-associated SURP domain-containing protein n=2 Tax=Perkinsus olseni TaxID=32597 RepID=A0A7J6UMW8_PEROL|nr:U2 snRNP-associated SURP domain-containing protein [Perkinsus olseni]